jgi:predicted DCC family thiol-disulfide oxidoreductase YuxK
MNNHHVIIFDGFCNLCNSSVNFIIKHDQTHLFVFAPMQSPAAQKLIVDYQVENIGFDTFILIKNGECFYRTNAAIEIAKDLSGAWYFFKAFKILPRFFRDYLYRLLARNRYSIFGKAKACRVPTKELQKKFLW